MLQNKRFNQSNDQKRVRPANRKFVELNSAEGKAKNRRGITYGAREAGGASEHFEPGGRLGISHTHGSRKVIRGGKGEARNIGKRKARHNEQRIVSG